LKLPPLLYRHHPHSTLIPAESSFNLCRFAEILGAIRFSAAGETVIAGFSGDSGDLVMHSVAAQHAQMPVMIGPAGTFRLILHHGSTFHVCATASKSVPILAGNVLKENAWNLA
jgi:hypothetical protein